MYETRNPVFIMIGLGGTVQNPEKIFCLNLDRINFTTLYYGPDFDTYTRLRPSYRRDNPSCTGSCPVSTYGNECSEDIRTGLILRDSSRSALYFGSQKPDQGHEIAEYAPIGLPLLHQDRK